VNREQAGAWLADVLGDRPLPAATVAELADAAGISERTLRRAKADVGAQSVKGSGCWFWKLPGDRQDQGGDRDAGHDPGMVAKSQDRAPKAEGPLVLRLLTTRRKVAKAAGVRVTLTYRAGRGWIEEPTQ